MSKASKPMTASEMGRKGGKSKSPAKVAAARRNGLLAALRRQIAAENKGKTPA